ncbi:hypothetical protein EUGRSUZ_J02457 [Eucalyptus grandis]|uniref:Uncharacterized protein n=2 Tax=Eucalyptus grandis TaxID=71139 RepID=A0ACC3J8S8_EUCGR|nr:hypothetical protein EUGRSUZ_J02457 [Eucalyptus grandis]
MIDQTTLGHGLIKSQFNKVPRVGWQIDPFGHSAVQAYLLGAEIGFDSMHFARIDYQDRANRKNDKSLEVIWRGSRTFGSSSQIFANAFPVHYSPPEGFNFEVSNDFEPVQDNNLLYDYNVEKRVNDFIGAAMTQDGRVNALYSTPSIYMDAKNAANVSWPLKTDDYLPKDAYWTGFFTSRPALKGYVRMLSGYHLAARQLEFLVGRRSSGPSTYRLGDALGLVQHHDALTGTAKQHTTNDYEKRLAIGASEAEAVVDNALSCLVSKKPGGQCSLPVLNFNQCPLLNISFCPATEEDIPDGKSLVTDSNFVIRDSSGHTVEAQLIDLDNVTINLRNFYVKAYLGLSPQQIPKYWIVFQVSLPPPGWNTYFISKAATEGESKTSFLSTLGDPQNDTIEVGPGDLKMLFSSTSGQLVRMFNSKTGVDVPVQQSYLYYSSSIGGTDDSPASNLYIFRPNGAHPTIVSRKVPLKVVRGPLVDEVHQQFSSWIYQVTRLHKDKEHADVEFTIGPIPTDDGVGKEVITQMTANMATEKTF